MFARWTTNHVRFADGIYRICTDPTVLAQSIKWGKSSHDFSGPHSVDAAFVTARSILRDCPNVPTVTITDFSGDQFVLFSC
jgi:hypothetical protein